MRYHLKSVVPHEKPTKSSQKIPRIRVCGWSACAPIAGLGLSESRATIALWRCVPATNGFGSGSAITENSIANFHFEVQNETSDQQPRSFPRVGIRVCDTRVLISATESLNTKSAE